MMEYIQSRMKMGELQAALDAGNVYLIRAREKREREKAEALKKIRDFERAKSVAMETIEKETTMMRHEELRMRSIDDYQQAQAHEIQVYQQQELKIVEAKKVQFRCELKDSTIVRFMRALPVLPLGELVSLLLQVFPPKLHSYHSYHS